MILKTKFKFEVTGATTREYVQKKTGEVKKMVIHQCYIHDVDRYPQACDYVVFNEADMVMPGEYILGLDIGVERGRLSIRPVPVKPGEKG